MLPTPARSSLFTNGNGLIPLARRRRLLVVESERATRDLLRLHLASIGDIEETGDGRRALERTRHDRFDLIVLDRTLPDVDGITLCHAMRTQGRNTTTPIVMLISPHRASDRALGLERGADDCVTTPVSERELLARVHAILRRSTRVDEPVTQRLRRVEARDVVLDPDRRQALVRGVALDLSAQEFNLLYVLSSRPGIVFSRTALLSRMCRRRDREVTGRTVDTTVSRLRQKIERDIRKPELILTAWGIGYKFADVVSGR
jgi:DNA-binding response OmpR family regulator